jgi:hypothetical protein
MPEPNRTRKASFLLRLDEDENDMLLGLRDELGLTASEILREALSDMFESHLSSTTRRRIKAAARDAQV